MYTDPVAGKSISIAENIDSTRPDGILANDKIESPFPIL
jgi:hypothetical protein